MNQEELTRAWVEEVKRVQAARGLNNADWSRLIGVDPSLHTLVLGGQKPGAKYLAGIMGNVPELQMITATYQRDLGQFQGAAAANGAAHE